MFGATSIKLCILTLLIQSLRFYFIAADEEICARVALFVQPKKRTYPGISFPKGKETHRAAGGYQYRHQFTLRNHNKRKSLYHHRRRPLLKMSLTCQRLFFCIEYSSLRRENLTTNGARHTTPSHSTRRRKHSILG